jgi:hypothetical protein
MFDCCDSTLSSCIVIEVQHVTQQASGAVPIDDMAKYITAYCLSALRLEMEDLCCLAIIAVAKDSIEKDRSGLWENLLVCLCQCGILRDLA